MRLNYSSSRTIRCLYGWASQVCDPRTTLHGVLGIGWYLRDWRRYKRMPHAEYLHLLDSLPQLHDRKALSPFDFHYFYMSSWAMRRIVAARPQHHLDIGSHNLFVGMMVSVVPLMFLDYRPLIARIEGLAGIAGSITALPFADASVSSLSCLHVAEHIGLGRYGDPLDPQGSRKAMRELVRVLACGGELYFAVPVGRERVCFNAHRVFAPQSVRNCFAELELIEFSGIDDNGTFMEAIPLSALEKSEYACGLFRFRKNARIAEKQVNLELSEARQ